MKAIRTTITILFFLGAGSSANSQFLKKLGKTAEKAAERAVLSRTGKEASKKTDQALDNVLNMEISPMGGQRIDPSSLPASYEFDWRYTLRMSHKKGDLKMHYFLNEEKNKAFGNKPEIPQGGMGEMLMVFDPTLSTTTILMDYNGKKTGTITKNPDMMKAASEETDMQGYEFREVGTKEILGFACQGFQVENEEALMTMYVAFDTPVSFNNVYGNDPKRLPKGFDLKWLEKAGENSLVMEMDFKNKKKPKQSVKMTCIDLEKESLTIDLSAYDFSFQNDMQKQR